jgi:hypothetical protein
MDNTALDEEIARRVGSLPWQPESRPQIELIKSPAHEILYGGSAGSGKSDALLGYAILKGSRSLLLRRQFPQLQALQTRLAELLGGRQNFTAGTNTWRLPRGNTLELGSAPNPNDVEKYQGQPHSEILIDECAHFSEDMVDFLSGWLRDADGKACRLICASNPPLTSEGAWMISRWADWVDTSAPDPAEANEVRHYIRDGAKWERVDPGTPGSISRTFIPARLSDNIFLSKSDYAARLNNLPPQMRDALLNGNFLAAAQDRHLQVIPNSWIREAQRNWNAMGHQNEPMTHVGIDCSRGGRDRTVIVCRYRHHVAEPIVLSRDECATGGSVAARVLQIIGDHNPRVRVDGIGVGASVVDHLTSYLGSFMVEDVQNAGKPIGAREGQFANRRAQDYWGLRTRLDPANALLSLPPSMALYSELGMPEYSIGPRGVIIQSKEDIIRKHGRSPDLADACVLACSTL